MISIFRLDEKESNRKVSRCIYLEFALFLVVHRLNHTVVLAQLLRHHVQSICIGQLVVLPNHLPEPGKYHILPDVYLHNAHRLTVDVT